MRPKYVGIEENQIFIWHTEYDEDTLEDYYEDQGYSNSYIDKNVELDEDNEAIKIFILDIDNQERNNFGRESVQIIYNYYITEDIAANDWDRVKKDEKFAIFDDDEDDIYASFFWLGFPYDEDGLKTELPYFISNSMNWADIKVVIKDYYQSLKYEKINVLRESRENGINIEIDCDISDDFEEREYNFKYTKNGVLWSYEFLYDGDTIIKVELDWGVFIEYDYLVILGIIAIISIIIIIMVKKREIFSRILKKKKSND